MMFNYYKLFYKCKCITILLKCDDLKKQYKVQKELLENFFDDFAGF